MLTRPASHRQVQEVPGACQLRSIAGAGSRVGRSGSRLPPRPSPRSILRAREVPIPDALVAGSTAAPAARTADRGDGLESLLIAAADADPGHFCKAIGGGR